MLAIKRIKKDLKDLIKNPLPGISLEPTEDDLKNLHFTVIGPEGSPYQGVPFHGSLEISDDYPNTSPQVFYHNHVSVGYGSSWSKDRRGFTYICMNINSNFEHRHREWKTSENDGWGPGNTLSTVLVQIQTAFFDSRFFSDQSDSIRKTLREALKFKCNVCGHDGSDPKLYQPEIKNPFSFSYLIKLNEEEEDSKECLIEEEEDEEEKDEKEEDEKDEKDEEEDDEKNEEEEKEVKKNKFLIEIIGEIEKKEEELFDPMVPICFATKERLSSQNQIYGIGCSWLENRFKTKIVNIGNLEFEYLSELAWNSGIKRTSTKKELKTFFPLYFNHQHWLLAKSKLEESITNLFETTQFDFHNKIINQTINHKSIGYKLLRIMNLVAFHKIDDVTDNRSESRLIYLYHWYQTIYQYRNDPDLVLELNQLENSLLKSFERGMINISQYVNKYILLLILRPERCSKLREPILNEIIYHNPNTYKSRYPDILDLSGKPVKNRVGKVFICLKNTFCCFLKVIKFIQAGFDLNQSLDQKQLKEYLTLDRESFKINSFQDFYQQLGEKFDPQKFEARIVSILSREIGNPMKFTLYDYQHGKIKKTRRVKYYLKKEKKLQRNKIKA